MAAAEIQLRETNRVPTKRKFDRRKGVSKPKDRHGSGAGNVTNKKKMRKVQVKRAAMEHDSDDDDEEGDGEKGYSEEEEEDGGGGSEDEGGDGMQEGVTKFTHGCRAFRTAFTKIMKKNVPADSLLGPILSAHQKLVVEKLAEEEEEHKVKGEAKKEKHLAGEKGHLKPASFLDSKEKFLISVATKGVVKLFNAVNKAQNPQKDLNPSRSKDAKVLAKWRKKAFLSEIRKSTTGANDNHSTFKTTKETVSPVTQGVPKSADDENNDEPGWAPLRDSYMLTNSKLKDWDKMADPSTSVAPDTMPSESSSDED